MAIPQSPLLPCLFRLFLKMFMGIFGISSFSFCNVECASIWEESIGSLPCVNYGILGCMPGFNVDG